MAFGDEQLTRFDKNLESRIHQIDTMLDAKIDRLEDLIKRIRMTNTTVFDTPEVEKAKANVTTPNQAG